MRPRTLLGAALLAGAVIVGVRATTLIAPAGARLSPIEVTVTPSSSLPPEVQALERESVAGLFDRNTGSVYTAFDRSVVEVGLEAAADIASIKVFGPAPYVMSVEALSGGAWRAVTGWQRLRLDQGAAGAWGSFAASAPINASRLRFTLESAPGGGGGKGGSGGAAPSGLAEIELWSGAGRKLARGPQGLEAAVVEAQSAAATPNLNGISARRYGATPENATVSPTQAAEFRARLDRSPAQARSAWVVYESQGYAHWISPLIAVNEVPAQGGAFQLTGSEWTTQRIPVSPQWLLGGTGAGENRVRFALPARTAGAFSVRNVRLLVEYDDGGNFIGAAEDEAGNAIDAVLDGDAATGWRIYRGGSSGTLTLRFDRPTQLDRLLLNLAERLEGSLRLEFLSGTTWSAAALPTVSGKNLSIGWNELRADTAMPVSALRLIFEHGAGSIAEVRELVLLGSGAGAAYAPEIVVGYPDAGQYFGRRAYIRGFVQPADNGSGPARIFVGGAEIAQRVGEIEALVSKDDVGYKNQSDTEPWQVAVDAVYPNGERASHTVKLGQYGDASRARGLLPSLAAAALALSGQQLANDEASLDIEPDALAGDEQIQITPLAEADLPRLDPGMVNVTKGPRRGYRFTPTPHKFRKPIKVTLPYDPARVPRGLTESDIKTYYFDKQAGRWVALDRARLDQAKKTVTSLTDHFTDMINATLVVPDHPQAVSFNPTQIKDIKAADPGAGINLIEPPRANNTGDARLSYPIEIPPGRAGMQPQLAIQYNSGGGNGWLGMGWDLSVPSISIDTRWGVPRYDGVKESETYLLNGEQLTPMAHRTEWTSLPDRSGGDKVFHTRVEGQFRKIVRHGTAPTNYWWEVTDKNGTRHFYGGVDASDASGKLGGTKGVFKWMLRRSVDASGNSVLYHYETVSDSGVGDGTSGVPGSQIYLNRIQYTGTSDNAGRYSVSFIRDTARAPGGRRADVQIDARGGFKQVTAHRLKRIDVKYDDALVRRYELNYVEGAFRKTLLANVVQYGRDGVTEFNRHAFSYFDEIRNAAGGYRGFDGITSWGIENDSLGLNLLGNKTVSALGGSHSSSTGGHFYFGVGPAGKVYSKELTTGLKVGYSRGTSETLIALVDVTGDGLPDKVFKSGSGFHYRKNLSGPSGRNGFGDAMPLSTLPAISKETVTTTTIGAESFGPEGEVGATGDVSIGHTRSDTYFADVNGDGLIDLVSGGQVLFGIRDGGGQPMFTPNSVETPAPIGRGVLDTAELLEDPSAIEAERAAKFPLMDTVRRWVAPWDGVVQIDAPVALLRDTSQARAQYLKADGVRVAIQLEGSELWSQAIGPDDYASYVPSGVNAVPVRRGDRLYFRVQSVANGAYDQVSWAPVIAYLNQDAGRTDVNGAAVYRYSAADDFTLFGRRGTIAAPLTGTLRVIARVEKSRATTDDIRLVLLKNGQEALSRAFGYAETTVGAPGYAELVQDIQVASTDQLEWRILTDSPVDATAIRFASRAYYVAAQGADAVTDDQGNYVLRLEIPYDMDLYPVGKLAAPDTGAPQGGYLLRDDGKQPRQVTLTVTGSATLSGLMAGDVRHGVFTVKRRGALLAKLAVKWVGDGTDNPVPAQPATAAGGGDPVPVVVDVTAKKGDELYFDFTTRDATLADGIGGLGVQIQAIIPPVPPATAATSINDVARAAFHAPVRDVRLFAQSWHGWDLLGYNGNGAWGTQAIEQSVLFIDDSYKPETARVYPYAPTAIPPRPEDRNAADLSTLKVGEGLWGSLDDSAWVKALQASASRLGLDDITMPRGADFAGAVAVPRISRSTNYGGSIGVSASTGESYSELDFQDINGDRYPDVVSKLGVQFTGPSGALQSFKPAGELGMGDIRKSDNLSVGASTSGVTALATTIANARARATATADKPADTGKQGSDMPSLGLSADINYGESKTKAELIDVNGDGLPDRVSDDGRVALNLGYGFAPAEDWNAGLINDGKTIGLGGGWSPGFNKGSYSIAAGLSLTISQSSSEESYVDVNGDGLPDKVIAGSTLKVRFNTGAGFTQEQFDWPNGHAGVANDKHITLGGGLYLTFGFNIPIPPTRFVFNPGLSHSQSLGRPEITFRDIDGDGLVDQLHSTRDSELKVARNRTGRTNLLKEVKRPLGAVITLDYKRSGNTYDQPHSKWVLASTAVFDGKVGNGPDYQISTYEYADGKYDRQERDFYGYRTVIEKQRNTAGVTALNNLDFTTLVAYRIVTRNFLTDSYYRKGLVERERMTDAQDRAFTETANSYTLFDVPAGVSQLAALVPADNLASSLTATLFPAIVKTEHRFFEGGQGAKSTEQRFEYDGYGNVTRFADAGDTGAADDVQAQIDYKDCTDSYIVGRASRIIVMDAAGTTLRHREGEISCASGNMTQVRQYVEGGVATTDLAYEDNGNLKSVTGPKNLNGEQYSLDYVYDPEVATHVIKISDSFGYESSATHDYRFAKPLSTSDLNGNQITYAYDDFGRTVSITGPYEQSAGTSQTPGRTTISFAYGPYVRLDEPYFDSWAKTSHYDRDAKGVAKDTIDTVLLADGLKRVLQTKKDATVEGLGDVMIVSGQVEFDAYGRTVKQFYPVTEPKVSSPAGNTGFNPIFDDSVKHATEMTYDVLDRNTSTTLPDLSTTTMAYGFGADRDGALRFRTTVMDANGKVKESYRDIRSLITAVKEFNAGQTLWTSYAYDPLKQITRVLDAKGNTTTVAYDLLGRRTAIDNPDTGKTETVYDLASNPVKKITAVLRLQGKHIAYGYRFNRLQSISYPDHPGNNVAYTYGDNTPAFRQYNQVGRIIQITSQAGVDERRYGKLGEVVEETKTVSSATQGNSANSPEVYTTKYDFDTFGRLMLLTLPDGEILTHTYDSGGSVAKIEGDKRGDHTVYLQSLAYDKFEQRTHLKLGNGIETRYSYRADNRRLANLKSEGSVAGRFQNIGYTYDPVGNILSLSNDVAIPPASGMGGPTASHFGYDDLYRLTHAQGNFKSSPSKVQAYTLDLQYNEIHNIVRKTQADTVTSNGNKGVPQKATTYDWEYAYTGAQPHAPSHIGDRTFYYDANGNQTGFTNDKNGTRRTIVWDEENRIQEIDDNGRATRFKYDDKGERVFKVGESGETVYINQFYVVRNRSIASKHVFAGTSRLATKLVGGNGNTRVPVPGGGSGAQPGGANGQGNAYGHSKDNPGLHLGQEKNGAGQGQGTPFTSGNPGQGRERRSDTANQHAQDVNKNPTLTGQFPGQGLAHRSARANEVAQNTEKNPHLIGIGGGTGTDGGSPGGSDWKPEENFLYFYHPDHLGSTGYITDRDGKLYEHIEYFPFGEAWVQEHSNTLRTPYLFTGKELDQETGLYYFGARYYDPRTSVWQSADPILGRYLGGQGNGGVSNPRNLALYSHTYNNPLVLTDPDGRAPIDPSKWTGREPLYTGRVGAPSCMRILCNSGVYDTMDTSLATGRVGAAIRSDWFAAASLVTGFLGLGGLDYEPDFTSEGAESYLKSVHHSLAKENYATFNALVSGNEVPGLEGRRGKALDYALVDKEQALVTKFTNEYFGSDKAARSKAFSEINQFFDPKSVLFRGNSEPVKSVIKERFERKGIKFDIGNEAHRRELGYGVVDYIRQQRNRDE